MAFNLGKLLWPLAVLTLTACAISRPNTDLCIVNAPNQNRHCYNLKTDYDSDGHIIAGHPGVFRDNKTVVDLNKATVVDSPTGFEDGLAALKAYVHELTTEYNNKCQPVGSVEASEASPLATETAKPAVPLDYFPAQL